ncbi:hypothetical protein [Candidatus Pantoea soli]|uniref:Dpoa decarboxylase n=1 Tax=Candidatus Pantoea soli TaxID=3098669 RepID=A0A518XJW1_9GAMM|nr:hypothetical protein [Pantoea soli]QDY44478.1 hypothetical protein D8B20_21360 [Pantoea soli]
MIDMTGYVRNPWSKEHDSIHADVLIRRIEKAAGKACGCHYEIYEKYCLDSLFEILSKLNADDARVLCEVAEMRGYNLSDEGMDAVDKAYSELMTEIHKEQI